MTLIGGGLVSQAGLPAGGNNQLQLNVAGNFFANNKLEFDGSTFKIVPITNNLTNILELKNAGDNPAQLGFKVGNVPPEGNVVGIAGEIYAHISAELTRLYMNRNAIASNADWFALSMNPPNKLELATAEEYEALGTAGVINITVSTTLEFINAFTSATRIDLAPGITLAIIGGDLATARFIYSGTGAWITTDGGGLIRVNGLTNLLSTSGAALFDVQNTIQGVFITNAIMIGWGTTTFKNVPLVVIKDSGHLNTTGPLIFDDCSGVISSGVSYANVNTTSGSHLQFKGNLKQQAIRIEGSVVTLNTDESLVKLDLNLRFESQVIVSLNTLNGPNKNLFAPNDGAPQIIESVAPDNVAGTLTTFADNFAGGTKVTPVSMAGLNDGQTIDITSTNYNAKYLMFNITGTTFDIPAPFAGNDTGSYTADSIIIKITSHGFSNGDFIELSKSNSYNGFLKIFKQTADTFNVSRPFAENQTGIVDIANSFDFKDERVLATTNPSVSPSISFIALSIVENTEDTIISAVNTFQDINISGKTGVIDSFASGGAGFTRAVTNVAHGLRKNQPVQIVDSSLYSDTFIVTNIFSTTEFDFEKDFTITDTGNFRVKILVDQSAQGFRASDESNGEIEYIANEPLGGSVRADMGALKSGNEEKYSFKLAVFRNGVEVVNARRPYVTVGIKTTLTPIGFSTPINLIKGDKLRVRTQGFDTTDNPKIVNFSLTAQGIQ